MTTTTTKSTRSKKPKVVEQEKRFPDEVDAYSYAIGYMFNPVDCSRRFDGSKAVIPFNKNDFLELFYNRIPVVYDVRRVEGKNGLTHVYRSPRAGEVGVQYKPKFVGKWWYDRHLTGGQTLYYRSKYNCCARVGYQSYDAGHKKLPWAERFGITGRSRRFPEVGWMLLGFDLDAKNDEPDMPDLRDWLLTFFPASYWEPSTGGKGIHLYVKLAYRVDHAGSLYQTLARVDDRVVRLCNQLALRASTKFRAKLDGIRSLPTVLAFDRDKRRVVVRKRYNCVKAPRCRQGMDDILRFHTAPFVLFQQVERLVQDLERERVVAPEYPTEHVEFESNESDEDEDVVVEVSDGTVVDDAAVEKLLFTDPADLLEGRPEEEDPASTALSPAPTALLYKKCTPTGTQSQKLAKIKAEGHGLMRKIGFVQWESRRLRGMQTVPHYLDRYEALGLARRPRRDKKRWDDMTAVVKFVGTTFDPAKGFSLDGYEVEREEIEKQIKARLDRNPEVSLTWVKEKGRSRGIDLMYLVAVYFALRRAARSGTAHATEAQLIDQCKQVINRKPHRNMMSAITSILRRLDLIEKKAGPVFWAGKFNRGTKWVVKA